MHNLCATKFFFISCFDHDISICSFVRSYSFSFHFTFYWYRMRIIRKYSYTIWRRSTLIYLRKRNNDKESESKMGKMFCFHNEWQRFASKRLLRCLPLEFIWWFSLYDVGCCASSFCILISFSLSCSAIAISCLVCIFARADPAKIHPAPNTKNVSSTCKKKEENNTHKQTHNNLYDERSNDKTDKNENEWMK